MVKNIIFDALAKYTKLAGNINDDNCFNNHKGETMTTATTTPLIELLAARWRASHDLTELYDSTMKAYETAFPSAENSPNISAAQRQTALVQFKSLIVECDQAAQALLLQGAGLAPAINALAIE